MSVTENYGLYISDDSSERFLDWRRKMNGETNSNMVKIDTALAGKAKNSVVKTAVLTAAGWQGATAPYTQELSVDGMTEDTNGSIGVDQSATVQERRAARLACLSLVGQEEGVLVIAADGDDKPEINIPIVMTIIG